MQSLCSSVNLQLGNRYYNIQTNLKSYILPESDFANYPTGAPCISHSFRPQAYLQPEAAGVFGDVGGEPQFKRAASVGVLDKGDHLFRHQAIPLM